MDSILKPALDAISSVKKPQKTFIALLLSTQIHPWGGLETGVEVWAATVYSRCLKRRIKLVIPITLSNPVMSMASWTKRQGEVTSHSRSYGEELQRSIFVQIASAIGDLESVIGIMLRVQRKKKVGMALLYSTGIELDAMTCSSHDLI